MRMLFLRVPPTVRRALACALAAAVLGGTLVAAPATASGLHLPAQWGFAYVDTSTLTPGTVLNPRYQAGSWMLSAPSRYATVRGSNGKYWVTFPLIGGPAGVAHVTAVSNDARWCQIFTNFSSSPGSDHDVSVRCFLPGGVEVPSRFAVTYLASDGTPSRSHDLYAYVAADLFGGTRRQYNPVGATNVVNHLATGFYEVILPGLATKGTLDGSVQVTAEHPNSPRRCNVTNWFPKGADIFVYVQCFDERNRPEYSWFNLTYHRKRPVFGTVYPPTNLAYVWSLGVGSDTDYNSTTRYNFISNAGPGAYRVTFLGVGDMPDHMQVTTYSSNPNYCHLADIWQTVGGDVVDSIVLCFDAATGRPTDSHFFATYSSLA